jgi:hypothetical protein
MEPNQWQVLVREDLENMDSSDGRVLFTHLSIHHLSTFVGKKLEDRDCFRASFTSIRSSVTLGTSFRSELVAGKLLTVGTKATPSGRIVPGIKLQNVLKKDHEILTCEHCCSPWTFNLYPRVSTTYNLYNITDLSASNFNGSGDQVNASAWKFGLRLVFKSLVPFL